METHFISEDADQHQSNMEIIKNQIQTLDSEQLLSVLEDEEKLGNMLQFLLKFLGWV